MKPNRQNKNTIKYNIKNLCDSRGIRLSDLLVELNLPKNYITVLGLVRLCNYFNLKIDDIIFKKL